MNNNNRINGFKKTRKKAVRTALVCSLIAGTMLFGTNAVMAEPITEISTVIGASEGLGSVQAVVEECMPSVVTISMTAVQTVQSMYGRTRQQEVQGAGTGVIVAQNDTELLIATNNHVVEGATSLSVGFTDGFSSEAVIRGTDASTDLAVIAVQLADIPEETRSQIRIAKIGSSDELSLGEQVVAIGNSLGAGQSVTTGCISAFGRSIPLSDGKNTILSSDLIQTDASINPGNSGGALLNMKGELVGINEAKSSYTSSGATVDNVGYAIPISKAMPILEGLMAQGNGSQASQIAQGNGSQASQPGCLGVTCMEITSDSEIAKVYGYPEGVCILKIKQGSPCAAAGLQKGDMIAGIDGREAADINAVKEVLASHAAGEQVTLTVLRRNNTNGAFEKITKTVTLCSQEAIQNT